MLKIPLHRQGAVLMFTRINQNVMPQRQILRTSDVIKQASGTHHDQTELMLGQTLSVLQNIAGWPFLV